MTRYWIAALRFSGPLPDPPPPGGTCELVPRVLEALDGLRLRVEGEIVLAAVPDERLAALLERCSGLPPLHLVLPFNPRTGGDGLACSEEDRDAWRRIAPAAASLNVPPGRGRTQADWADCETWLETVTDLEIAVGAERADPPFPAEKDGPRKRPRVIVDPAAGTVRYEGFPREGRLVDRHFRQLAGEAFGGNSPEGEFDEIREFASAAADRSAPRVRFLQTGALLLNISPGLILAASAAFLWMPGTTAIAKFAASLLAALSAIGLKRLAARRRWLAARAITEICRSLDATAGLLDPLFPPAARFLPGHASFARSLALGLSRPETSLAAARDRYLKVRLDDQIRYYSDEAAEAGARRRLVRWLFYIATALSLVSTAAALLGSLDLLPWIPGEILRRWIAGVSTFLFPSLAAAAVGFLAIHESTRRADYYAELAGRLRDRLRLLAALRSESSITEAVRECESMLLEEVAGWQRRQVF